MSAAATTGGGVLEIRGEEPAGRLGAASRRRSLGFMLLFAMGAAAAGSALGLLAQPNRPDRSDDLAFTAAAAVDTARRAEGRARAAEARARAAEEDLALAKSRIEAFNAVGAAQELADVQEAERLGVSRFMKGSTALWG